MDVGPLADDWRSSFNGDRFFLDFQDATKRRFDYQLLRYGAVFFTLFPPPSFRGMDLEGRKTEL